jgi:hypothetical protein
MKEGIRQPPKKPSDASAAAEISAVAEATADVSAVAEIFDSEIRDSFRLCPANSHLPKLIIGPPNRSCAKNINWSNLLLKSRNILSDNSFGKTINRWILFT